MSQSETTTPATTEILVNNEPVNPPVQEEQISRDLAMEFAQRMSTAGSGANTPTSKAPQVSPSVAKDWALLRDPVFHNERLEAIRQKKGYIIDMDGVIYHASIHGSIAM